MKISENIETPFYTHLKSEEPIIVRSEGVWFARIEEEARRRVEEEGRKRERDFVENKLEAYDSFKDVLGRLITQLEWKRREEREGGGGEKG